MTIPLWLFVVLLLLAIVGASTIVALFASALLERRSPPSGN